MPSGEIKTRLNEKDAEAFLRIYADQIIFSVIPEKDPILFSFFFFFVLTRAMTLLRLQIICGICPSRPFLHCNYIT